VAYALPNNKKIITLEGRRLHVRDAVRHSNITAFFFPDVECRKLLKVGYFWKNGA